jgi:hypothetical protein
MFLIQKKGSELENNNSKRNKICVICFILTQRKIKSKLKNL